MAVHGRGYRTYTGPRTPAWTRFLVIARYALADVFTSRLFIGFFVACFVPPLAAAVLIYLHYNVEALTILDLSVLDLIKIDKNFFWFGVLRPQSTLAFLLVLAVAPGIVSPDLRNNAMPLLLSRPLDKLDYILGKLVVVVGLGSAITWVPGLVLFALQVALGGRQWFLDNMRIGVGIFFGQLLWVVTLGLFGLAVSAWIKWKPWARIVFLGSVFVATATGTIFKALYGTWWGSLFVLDDVFSRVWSSLFGMESRVELPVAAAWITVFVFAALSLFALHRRIRAYEVIS